MKFFRGFLSSGSNGEESDGYEPTERARVAVQVSDQALVGHWKFPDDKEGTMKMMDGNVFRQEPMYGTGKNRTNGFDPNVDAAIFHKCLATLVKDIEDDTKKPVIRTTLKEKEPLLGKKSEFYVELEVREIDEDGNPLGWKGPFKTDTRPRKADLVALVADLLDTKVPSIVLNEDFEADEPELEA